MIKHLLPLQYPDKHLLISQTHKMYLINLLLFLLIKSIDTEIYVPPFQILTMLPQEQSTQLSRDLRKVVNSYQQNENIIYTKLLGNLASIDAQTNTNLKFRTTSSTMNNVIGNDKNRQHLDDHNLNEQSNENNQLHAKQDSNHPIYNQTLNILNKPLNARPLNNRSTSKLSPSQAKSTNRPNLKLSSKLNAQAMQRSTNRPFSQATNHLKQTNQTIQNRKITQSNVIITAKQLEILNNYEVLQNDAQFAHFNETNSFINSDITSNLNSDFNSDYSISDSHLTSHLNSDYSISDVDRNDLNAHNSLNNNNSSANASLKNGELLENQQPPMVWTRLRLAKTNTPNSMAIRPADIPLFSSPLAIGNSLANILPSICDQVEIYNPSLILSLLDTERHQAAAFISQAAFIPMLSYTKEYQINPTSMHVS